MIKGLHHRGMQTVRRLYRRSRAMLRPVRSPKLVALTVTRNEDWVLGLSLRASLSYCDAVVIADHGSTDGTAQIIRDAGAQFPQCAIDVRRVEQPDWREAEVRQEMLERGRALGGTHFVIVDADEVPTGNLLPQLRKLALGAHPGCYLTLPMIAPYHTRTVYRWDGPWGEQSAIPWAFGDSQELEFKVTGTYQLHRRIPAKAIHQGQLLGERARGGLFHLQFVNKGRLQSKAAWYKMIETVSYPGKRSAADLNKMYDWSLREAAEAKLDTVPKEWWCPYEERGWLRFFAPDAPPWQLDAARSLAAQHGQECFSGLDLHGIV